MDKTEFGERIRSSTRDKLVALGEVTCFQVQKFMKNAINKEMFKQVDISDSDLGLNTRNITAKEPATDSRKPGNSNVSKSSIDLETNQIQKYTLEIRETELENSADSDKKEVVCYGITPEDYTGVVCIPEGVTQISDCAFRGTHAKEFVLPETLKYIGENAFQSAKLSKITIPKGVKTIMSGTFRGCANLSTINMQNIKAIASQAFAYSGIIEIDIPKDVEQITKEAFERCYKLKRVTHTNNLRRVYDRAFFECRSLEEFDTHSIEKFGQDAFHGTNLSRVYINATVEKLLRGTFVGDNIKVVEIPEGRTQVDNGAVRNTKKEPVEWTLSKDIENIGDSTISKGDTVKCWQYSVADVIAGRCGAHIEYLGEVYAPTKVTVMHKAKLFGRDINKIISDIIQNAYDAQDAEYDFELQEVVGKSGKLINSRMSEYHNEYLGIDFATKEAPEGYKEKPKFKILLDHYRRASRLTISPLQKEYLAMRKTISVTNKEIYNDGVSRIIEFTFYDSKFFSLNSKLIVAFTGNRVRYSCLNNRLTDLWCKTPDSKDVGKLLDALQKGDLIGNECCLCGVILDSVYGTVKSTVLKKDAGGNNKQQTSTEEIKVNLYQALFRSSIAVKLQRNEIALILPVNKKILVCETVGKENVWNNEKKESYKDRSCYIKDIVDLSDADKVFGYNHNDVTRNDQLFKVLNDLDAEGIRRRVAEYAVESPVEMNAYFRLAKYMMSNGMNELHKLDLGGIDIMMQLPIIETRTATWFEKKKGTAVVSHSTSEVEFAGGNRVRQYATITPVKMKNKLITGGDKKTYVFEIMDFYGRRQGVYAALKPMKDTYSDCSKVVESLIKIWRGEKKARGIYTNKEKFDVVDVNELTFIAKAFEKEHGLEDEWMLNENQLWLAVSNDDGLYYLVYAGHNSLAGRKAAILLRLGDIDVISDLVSFERNRKSDICITLNDVGWIAIRMYDLEQKGAPCQLRDVTSHYKDIQSYESILQARNLSIDNVESIEAYMNTGVPSRVAHMIGVIKEDITPLDEDELDNIYEDEYEPDENDEIVEDGDVYSDDDEATEDGEDSEAEMIEYDDTDDIYDDDDIYGDDDGYISEDDYYEDEE